MRKKGEAENDNWPLDDIFSILLSTTKNCRGGYQVVVCILHSTYCSSVPNPLQAL